MKYSLMVRIVGNALGGMIKEGVPDRKTRKKIKQTYKEIFTRAKDIGSSNRLLTAYMLAAYYIAMNRCTDLGPERAMDILEGGMRKSSLLKGFMGSGKDYFSEKNMESRRQWSKELHQHKYENDWDVEVLEKGPDYAFGFNYTQCGVCKLCRDEGCPELAKYQCRLDYMLVDIMGIGLKRTMTLAEGADHCDFRFYEIKH